MSRDRERRLRNGRTEGSWMAPVTLPDRPVPRLPKSDGGSGVEHAGSAKHVERKTTYAGNLKVNADLTIRALGNGLPLLVELNRSPILLLVGLDAGGGIGTEELCAGHSEQGIDIDWRSGADNWGR
jgi:hypothetical protein